MTKCDYCRVPKDYVKHRKVKMLAHCGKCHRPMKLTSAGWKHA